MTTLYKGNKEKLVKALDSTSVTISVIARTGKMSINTAKKIFNEKSVQKSKANGAINALNEHGKEVLVFEDFFSLVENTSKE